MRIDLKAARPDLYRPSARDFTEVDVPETRYLAADGAGDPNVVPAYGEAVAALYAAAYAVRAALRADTGDELVVGPLEGLWSSPDPRSFVTREKDAWEWTMLIPLPDLVTPEHIESGLDTALERKPGVAAAGVHPLVLHEGRSLQILHVGPYDDEGPVLARLHDEVMPARGLAFAGRHHEIYLGDPRRSRPERLRTVLRQPVAPVGDPRASAGPRR